MISAGLRVPDLAGDIVPVDVGLLEEHVQASLVLSKRVTSDSKIGENSRGSSRAS